MSLKHSYELNVEDRSLKYKARDIIESDYIPAILYNLKGQNKSTPIQVKYNSMAPKIEDPSLLTKIFKINLNSDFHDAIIKDIQFHPVKGTITHIDFMCVYSDSRIKVNVPVRGVNADKCPGIKTGGDYFVAQYTTEVIGLASNIPHHIDADLTGKKIGDTILTSHITLPETCKFLRPGLLVRVSGKRVIEDKVEAAPTAAAEPAKTESAK